MDLAEQVGCGQRRLGRCVGHREDAGQRGLGAPGLVAPEEHLAELRASLGLHRGVFHGGQDALQRLGGVDEARLLGRQRHVART